MNQMDLLCSPLNSFELLTPFLGKLNNQTSQQNLDQKENQLQPFTSYEINIQLFSFLKKDGYSNFKILEKSVHYLLISCYCIKQNQIVFLTILRTTKEDHQYLCQKYQQIIGQSYLNILKYTDIIYFKQLFATILVSQQFEKTLQQEIEYRLLSKKLFTDEQLNQIIIQLFSSLSEIHERGVYHQNINLSKIVITQDKQYRLFDFNFPLNIRYRINSSYSIDLQNSIHRQVHLQKYNKQQEDNDIQQALNTLLQILQFQNKIIEKHQNRPQEFNKDLQLLLESNQSDYQNINPSQKSKNSLAILNETLPFLNLTQTNYEMLKEIVDKSSQKQIQIQSNLNEQQIEIAKLNLFITKRQSSHNSKQVAKAQKLVLQNQQSDLQSFLQLNLDYLQYLLKQKAFKSSKIINLLINISKIYDDLGQLQKSLQYSLEALKFSQERYKDNHYALVNSYIKVSKSYQMLKEYQKSEEAINKGLQIYSMLSRGHKKVNKKDLYQIIDDLDTIEVQILDV